MSGINEALLELESNAAAAFQEEHGTLEGFAKFWEDIRPGQLIQAKQIAGARNKLADEKQEIDKTVSMHERPCRSQMTAKQKAEFVGQHGLEAFQSLPA